MRVCVCVCVCVCASRVCQRRGGGVGFPSSYQGKAGPETWPMATVAAAGFHGDDAGMMLAAY